MRPAATAWSRAVGIGLVATAAAALAALLAPLGWPFELFAHFRWQVGFAAFALLLASLLLRRPWMMALASACLLLQLLPGALASRAVARDTSMACGGAPLRVATANVQFSNADHGRLLAWLEQGGADIVALQEVTPAWAVALESLAASYPHRRLLPRDDPYGLALLSKWPLRAVKPADFAADGLPSLVATVEVDGRPLQLVVLHTHWPVVPGLQKSRDLALQRAAAVARQRPEATILLGDLNLTPYAPAFGRLLLESGLRDAFDNRGWRPTWQAGLWPLALPIDHVLVPQGSCEVTAAIGPEVGSDHRPVLVGLHLP